ncbi:hypothetical protein GGR56DRAFT_266739 [Xylariaceae sp. FL0804]|nr:hypothetical protein GGR56DRAFT_266739 [Xylariaceae sp. FL0804]
MRLHPPADVLSAVAWLALPAVVALTESPVMRDEVQNERPVCKDPSVMQLYSAAEGLTVDGLCCRFCGCRYRCRDGRYRSRRRRYCCCSCRGCVVARAGAAHGYATWSGLRLVSSRRFPIPILHMWYRLRQAASHRCIAVSHRQIPSLPKLCAYPSRLERPSPESDDMLRTHVSRRGTSVTICATRAHELVTAHPADALPSGPYTVTAECPGGCSGTSSTTRTPTCTTTSSSSWCASVLSPGSARHSFVSPACCTSCVGQASPLDVGHACMAPPRSGEQLCLSHKAEAVLRIYPCRNAPSLWTLVGPMQGRPSRDAGAGRLWMAMLAGRVSETQHPRLASDPREAIARSVGARDSVASNARPGPRFRRPLREDGNLPGPTKLSESGVQSRDMGEM